MKLEKIKKEYEKAVKKHNLPKFKDINETFEIEKIKKESDIFVRSIRKIAMEKVVNTLGFVDMLLNPVNAPRMYFSYLKSITPQDKEDLERIYKILAELSVLSLERELLYNEKAEAELVKKVFSSWRSLTPEFERMMKKMKSPDNSFAKKERSYFG